MLRPSRALARPAIAIAGLLVILAAGVPSHGAVTREDVERAIRDGLRYLKQEQRADGSWDEVSQPAKTGTTSLVTLALLTAGEKPDSPSIRKALTHLRSFGPGDLRSTYAIALQTMVFAAAEPERDQLRIAANVSWLESAQIKPPESLPAAGPTTNPRKAVTTPIPSTPCLASMRPARLGCRSKPRSGPWRGVTGRTLSAGMEAGDTMPATSFPPRA